MLPISAIIGISTIGYFLDKTLKNENENENFNENENQNLNENENQNQNISKTIDGNLDNFPWEYVQKYNENNKFNSQSLHGQSSPLTPQNIIYPDNITSMNNAGNPSAPYLINSNDRPVEDFKINNMVPFFSGSGTNQDMRGTGVSESNYNSNNYNLGNNNSTPYYHTLANNTGCDDTYLHKREIPSLFSPIERRTATTIPGDSAESQRPLRDRYTNSLLIKNDEAPFERIQVGPGINIDADMPTDGQGYNAGISTKIKPNNYNAYRLTQLPGRVAGGKYQFSNLPTALPGTGPSFESFQNSKSNNLPTALPGTGPSFESFQNSKSNNYAVDNNKPIDTEKLINEGSMYGVPMKKPDLSTELTPERRPFAATPAVTQAPSHYSNYIMPSATDKRTITNVSFGQSVEVK